jgi:hypothetical protein
VLLRATIGPEGCIAVRGSVDALPLFLPAVSHPRSPIEHKRAIVGCFCIHYEVPVPLKLERSTAKLRYGQ